MEQIRPFPPTDLIDRAEEQEAILLAPAVDLKEWVVKNWLTIGGELHNPDHDHIAELLHDDETFLAFAWASSACVAKKRMVLGQCEKVMFNQGGWKKARQEQQMRDWFGFVPQYLITVDAAFCEQASDREFCRLIEHELYHIGVSLLKIPFARQDDGRVEGDLPFVYAALQSRRNAMNEMGKYTQQVFRHPNGNYFVEINSLPTSNSYISSFFFELKD